MTGTLRDKYRGGPNGSKYGNYIIALDNIDFSAKKGVGPCSQSHWTIALLIKIQNIPPPDTPQDTPLNPGRQNFSMSDLTPGPFEYDVIRQYGIQQFIETLYDECEDVRKLINKTELMKMVNALMPDLYRTLHPDLRGLKCDQMDEGKKSGGQKSDAVHIGILEPPAGTIDGLMNVFKELHDILGIDEDFRDHMLPIAADQGVCGLVRSILKGMDNFFDADEDKATLTLANHALQYGDFHGVWVYIRTIFAQHYQYDKIDDSSVMSLKHMAEKLKLRQINLKCQNFKQSECLLNVVALSHRLSYIEENKLGAMCKGWKKSTVKMQLITAGEEYMQSILNTDDGVTISSRLERMNALIYDILIVDFGRSIGTKTSNGPAMVVFKKFSLLQFLGSNAKNYRKEVLLYLINIFCDLSPYDAMVLIHNISVGKHANDEFVETIVKLVKSSVSEGKVSLDTVNLIMKASQVLDHFDHMVRDHTGCSKGSGNHNEKSLSVPAHHLKTQIRDTGIFKRNADELKALEKPPPQAAIFSTFLARGEYRSVASVYFQETLDEKKPLPYGSQIMSRRTCKHQTSPHTTAPPAGGRGGGGDGGREEEEEVREESEDEFDAADNNFGGAEVDVETFDEDHIMGDDET
jgi:hypothetical protein